SLVMKSCSKNIRQLTISGDKLKCTVDCRLLTVLLLIRQIKKEKTELQQKNARDLWRSMVVPWESSRASRRKTLQLPGVTRTKSAQFFGRKHNSSAITRKMPRPRKHTSR